MDLFDQIFFEEASKRIKQFDIHDFKKSHYSLYQAMRATFYIGQETKHEYKGKLEILEIDYPIDISTASKPAKINSFDNLKNNFYDLMMSSIQDPGAYTRNENYSDIVRDEINEILINSLRKA